VSPCRAVDRRVAVSTDAWRTGFRPRHGRCRTVGCFTDGLGRTRWQHVPPGSDVTAAELPPGDFRQVIDAVSRAS